MKKLVAGLMALATVAAVAQADDVVTSKNAVGFINRTGLEKGKQYALTVPFQDMSGAAVDKWLFENLDIAKSAPNGSSFYFWNGETQAWVPITKNKLNGKWTGFPYTPYYVEVGQFFFFRPGADMDSAVIAGEVPDEVVKVPVFGQKNTSAVGLPYPVEKNFNETDLYQNALKGDQVFFWDETAQAWVAASVNALNGKWSKNADRMLAPGEGFFYRSTGSDPSTLWEQAVPYDWPNASKE